MGIHFSNLSIDQGQGAPTYTLDQILQKIGSLPARDPNTQDLKSLGSDIQIKAQKLCDSVLGILVFDLDTLRKRFHDQPAALQTMLAERIEASISKLPPACLKEMGIAIGMDETKYPNFTAALAREMAECLSSGKNIGKALDLISAADFLKRIAGSDSSLLKDLKDLTKEVSSALRELRILTLPTEPTFPILPPTPVILPRNLGIDLGPIIPQITFVRRKDEDLTEAYSHKKTSVIDLIVAACKSVEEAAKIEDEKKEETAAEAEAKEDKRKKSIEDIARKNPELREIIVEILGDPHFSDSPVTQFQKLEALAKARQKNLDKDEN